jgi:hypothetical protein
MIEEAFPGEKKKRKRKKERDLEEKHHEQSTL